MPTVQEELIKVPIRQLAATCFDVLQALHVPAPVSLARLQSLLAAEEAKLSVALCALEGSGRLVRFGSGRSACYCLSEAALQQLQASPQQDGGVDRAGASCLQQGNHVSTALYMHSGRWIGPVTFV